MKPHEIKRLHLIQQALDKKISQKPAAEVAGLSPRQMPRLMKRVEQEVDGGILHRRRGKPSNRRIADKTKQKVLALFEKHYADYGPTLASGQLQERPQIEVHPETLRLWLRQARLPCRQRKARPHRQWRQRRRCFGERAQLDGSIHLRLPQPAPELSAGAAPASQNATECEARASQDHSSLPGHRASLNCRGFPETLMIADIHKPDISTLVTGGHFYFGWTNPKAQMTSSGWLG
jgi:hypothetical protein